MLAQQDFVQGYREHADVARVQHPGIRRYVQDIVTTHSGEPRWACSAISELHFAGEDDYREHFWRDESSRDIVAKDVERFSDPGSAKMVLAREVWRD